MMLTVLTVVGVLILVAGGYFFFQEEEEVDGGDPGRPVEERPPDNEIPIDPPPKPKPKPRPIEELFDLPERAISALQESGIVTVEDLEQVDDLTEIDRIGETYAQEIREEMRTFKREEPRIREE